jgi:hypothetical protein
MSASSHPGLSLAAFITKQSANGSTVELDDWEVLCRDRNSYTTVFPNNHLLPEDGLIGELPASAARANPRPVCNYDNHQSMPYTPYQTHLPRDIQHELFEHAMSMGSWHHTADQKSQIARFLHKHKDQES